MGKEEMPSLLLSPCYLPQVRRLDPESMEGESVSCPCPFLLQHWVS